MINNYSLKYFPYIFGLFDITLAWQKPEIDWHSKGFARYEANLSVDQICLDLNKISYCSDKSRIEFFYNFFDLANPLNTLRRINIDGIKLRISSEFKNDREKKEISLKHIYVYEDYINIIKNLDIERIQLGLAEIIILSGKNIQSVLSGHVNLKKQIGLLSLVGDIKLEDATRGDYLRIDLANQNVSPIDRPTYSLAAKYQNTIVSASWTTDQSIRYQPYNNLVRFNLESDLFSMSSNGDFQINHKTIIADFSVTIVENASETFFMNLDSCHYEGDFYNLKSLKGSLACEVQALLDSLDQGQKHLLNVENRLQYQLSPERYLIDMLTSVSEKVSPKPLISILGSMYTQLEGSYVNRWPRIISSIDLSADLAIYKDLVSRLKSTKYAIPSPLNELDGQLSCKLVGTYDNAAFPAEIPLNCKVDLSSNLQKISAQVDTSISISKNKNQSFALGLHGLLKLSESSIYLPNIDIGSSLPGLFSDDRVVKATRHVEKLSKNRQKLAANAILDAFSYKIRIQTNPLAHIYIHHKSLEAPLPLIVDFILSSESAMQGRVDIENHVMSLFRRNVMVRRLTLNFDPITEQRLLSGLLEFDHANASVKMRLSGSIQHPTMIFESEPPIPDSEIYAGLLFGGSTDTLSSNSLRSIEEARAAFTDGAISLLSMYYLASTPIESIGYNPYNRHFVARVRLPNGLLLSIGQSQTDGSELSLKKRIGRNWTIETKATKDQATGENRGQALLRWGRRY